MALRRMDYRERDKDKQRINEAIRVPQVRVISAEGEQLGIIATREALEIAKQAGLDLVEVAANDKPPVCRIMDYGKFRYQQKKKLTKQHTHQTKLKEVRLRPKTGEHDILVKVNKIKEFLANKDKVQITITFKGRELAHIDEGQKVINQIITDLEEVAKIEAPPKRVSDKRISATLAPK